MLICMGHRDAWDYGYSFFKTSLSAISKVFKQMIQGQAIAIGLGLFGKKDDWDKFMKE